MIDLWQGLNYFEQSVLIYLSGLILCTIILSLSLRGKVIPLEKKDAIVEVVAISIFWPLWMCIAIFLGVPVFIISFLIGKPK